MKHAAYFVLVLIGMCSCSMFKKKPVQATDLKLFKNTPVWDVAEALYNHEYEKATLFFEESPDLIDYQEKKFYQTLLLWAVKNEMVGAVDFMLELEADTELKDRYGIFPIIQAAHYKDTYLLKLLIKHEANTKVVGKPKGIDAYQKLRTPLIAAASVSNKNIDILLEAGADLDYTETRFGLQNAVITAFSAKRVDIVKHLIMDKKINLDNIQYLNYRGDSTDVRTELRKLVYPLDSEEYKVKMEIVDYLIARKINYWDSPVPRNLYHNFSPKYLKQY
ncbi:MAG: ankyrin repeat protein [Saprospiraceae bacterium]|jgi:ankyrin repeat protein